jgi:hypothetical protein
MNSNPIFRFFLAALLFVAFFATSCDRKSVCDDLEFDEPHTVSFLPSVKVVDKNTGDPIQNAQVNFRINHQYCSGEENGFFDKSGPTGYDGYFNTGMIYTYKYNTPEDLVRVYITATFPGYRDATYNNTYYWHNVEGVPQVVETFVIKLSPSTK